MSRDSATRKLKPPYPWFGGKARVAPMVWDRFGDVPNYVEPFFGGGAVMLARPTPSGTETINDINAWLCNFWRAVKAAPDVVAEYAADPVSEIDLHARGDWLFYRPGVDREFVERLRGDPEFYCAKSAGWWVWGQSSWIGDNWGRRQCRSLPHFGDPGMGVNRQLPHLSRGRGVNRQLPHLSGPGMGINRQLPHLGNAGTGVTETTRMDRIRLYMRDLCERMSRVRICCGDWLRVLGPTPTTKLGITGVFLDPPYAVVDRETVYGADDSRTVAHDVRKWCLENGDNPLLRIALCGYDDEHIMPDSWKVVVWKAHGGYGNQSGLHDNPNARRERIWFSPHCIDSTYGPLFADHFVSVNKMIGEEA